MLTIGQVELAAHFIFRVIGLIVIPLIVYLFSFYIHFLILENSGPGDAQMSSLFQANLIMAIQGPVWKSAVSSSGMTKRLTEYNSQRCSMNSIVLHCVFAQDRDYLLSRTWIIFDRMLKTLAKSKEAVMMRSLSGKPLLRCSSLTIRSPIASQR